jgi:hypothetical protein
MSNPKWKCPNCGSTDVQISLPAWHTETADGTLTYVETDSEADVQGWYCDACNDADHGEPDRVEDSE